MKFNRKFLTATAVVTCLSLNTLGVFAGPEGADYDSKGIVTFAINEEPTLPMDPENPGTTVVPGGDNQDGTAGPLSIDFASSFNFGEQTIVSTDATYNALPQSVTVTTDDGDTPDDTSDDTTEIQDRPNYVQITDGRGTAAGWSLRVQQNDQFINGTNVLTGAAITIKNITVVSNSTATTPSNVSTSVTLTPNDADGDNSSLIMSAAVGEGAGTYIAKFGDTSTMGDSVSLFVPGSTAKYAGGYETALTWVLTDVPE